jgi:alpha-amylase
MTSKHIRLVLVLHNHQPIGNFEHVFENAFQDSYHPFLEVLSRYPSLKVSMHVSGSLMEWLNANHPDYVDRLGDMVVRGQIEILGGAFYEPILAMLPSRDRIGQIRTYSRWLEDRLGTRVRGMWVPERVWEQTYVRDLVEAGIEYTVLDDFHFKNAGLAEEQLHGYYLTEDDGRVMAVFPGSEPLRYWIPFADPQQTIDYLSRIADQQSDAVAVFGDDGEKFGTWPQTKKHVYTDGWLERFFGALAANASWLQVTTLAEAADNVRPLGKIYLPDSSYREMIEWALPAEQQIEYERVVRAMEHDPRWPAVRRFFRAGYWRNFRVKYPEADEMYSRMMAVSRRVAQASDEGHRGEWMDQARTELYRAQCNCGYWHGAFGGIYLPHLRNAIYHHLIAAEEALDQELGRQAPWVEARAEDFNFDGRHEVQLANDKLLALLAPGGGAQMYELDVRSIRHNLLATLARRPEAYHAKVLSGRCTGNGEARSIHDVVVCKQEGLHKRVQYDRHPRKSLVDHFYNLDATLDQVSNGQAAERGDFVLGAYEARLRRNPDRIQVLMVREGDALGAPIRLTKGVTLSAGRSVLEIAYLLEGLPKGWKLHFGVEFNFAGLPAGAEDRYFHDLNEHRLGQLGSRLDLSAVEGLGLVDEWLGIDVRLSMSKPTSVWTFPIETVSNSEGGFELVHQSVVVHPHWIVEPDADGRWSITMQLALDTHRAERRAAPQTVVAATLS